MLKILGKYYYVDLTKLCEFIDSHKENDDPRTQTITATYNDDLSILSKEIVESKTNVNDIAHSMKFDAIRLFLDPILSTTYDVEGALVSGEVEHQLS